MSYSPQKLPRFAAGLSDEDVITEDCQNENLLDTDRQQESAIPVTRAIESRIAVSAEKSATKHIERIRNSYKKKLSSKKGSSHKKVNNFRKPQESPYKDSL